jgi:hypothetical protein
MEQKHPEKVQNPSMMCIAVYKFGAADRGGSKGSEVAG